MPIEIGKTTILGQNDDGSYRIEVVCTCGDPLVIEDFMWERKVRDATITPSDHRDHVMPFRGSVGIAKAFKKAFDEYEQKHAD